VQWKSRGADPDKNGVTDAYGGFLQHWQVVWTVSQRKNVCSRVNPEMPAEQFKTLTLLVSASSNKADSTAPFSRP
jgi:hypothetical protein